MASSVLLKSLRPASTQLARSSARVGIQRRTLLTLKDHKYSAHATASGQGRNGTAKSSEKEALEVKLAMPSSLGGKGDGQNPEVLFAMGYSSCFLASMQLHAHNTKKTVPKDTKVYATVHLGQPSDMDGFGIAVDIEVEGVEDQELIDGGHAGCPYSRALAHRAVVNVSKKK